MKNNLTYFLIFIGFTLFAQTTVYELDPVHTGRKLKESKASPSLYSVGFRKIDFTSGGGNKKVINKDYLAVEKQIEELREVEISNEGKQDLQRQKEEKVKSIGTLINDFLASESEFNDKKDLLREAQLIANNYNVKGLIYADSDINSSSQAKFKLLAMNDFDLKIHLKRILWDYEEMEEMDFDATSTADIEIDSNAIKLTELETQLSEMKKYSTVQLAAKTTTRSALLIGSKVPSVKKLKGDFVPIGVYYIVKKDFKNTYKKGEIISSKDYRNSGLPDASLVSSPQLLFKNKESKAVFISEMNFLDRFAFLINGKFNNKSIKKKRVAAL